MAMVMPRFYRKRPVVVQALQWTGENLDDMARFCGAVMRPDQSSLLIITLEGTMRADKGDYVIRGVKGEFYPCKPDIFTQTYETDEPGAEEAG